MRRRQFLMVAGSLLSAPLLSRAQTRGQVARIGCLWVDQQGLKQYHAAFVDGLNALGYVDGRNLKIDIGDAQGDLSRLPAVARDLVALRPDVILASNPAGVGAALSATRAIPIVMGTMSDPVAEGFVASLARPGGNVTGLVNQGEDLIPKHFELVHELVPRAARIAFLISQAPALQRRNASFELLAGESARRLGLTMLPVRVSSRLELEKVQQLLANERADALVVALDPIYVSFRKILVDATGKLRLPAVYPLPSFSEDGGLLSYGFNLGDSFRRAATYVDKILKGAKPGDLPVERPLKFEMIVNFKTAKALGIKIPQSVVLRADRVLE